MEGQGYKITLNLDGGKLYNNGYYPETFYVKPGEKCKYYPDPVRDDAAFLGWYDEAGNQIWSISTYTPVKDTVINAKWTTDMVRVRVHSGGSSLYNAYTGKYTTVQIYNVARGKSITGNTYLIEPEKWGLTDVLDGRLQKAVPRQLMKLPIFLRLIATYTQFGEKHGR